MIAEKYKYNETNMIEEKDLDELQIEDRLRKQLNPVVYNVVQDHTLECMDEYQRLLIGISR